MNQPSDHLNIDSSQEMIQPRNKPTSQQTKIPANQPSSQAIEKLSNLAIRISISHPINQ
jgi:hypothetical protein